MSNPSDLMQAFMQMMMEWNKDDERYDIERSRRLDEEARLWAKERAE